MFGPSTRGATKCYQTPFLFDMTTGGGEQPNALTVCRAKAMLQVPSCGSNPLGPSPAAVQNLRKMSGALGSYPSTLLEAAKAAIARTSKVDPSNLKLGDGSPKLFNTLSRLILKEGDEAIICEHGSKVCETLILGNGALPVIVKNCHFGMCIYTILRAINKRTKLVYLSNPANPTGLCLDVKAFWALQRAIPAHVTIVLDLSYADYITDRRFVLPESKLGDNVVTIRALSKLQRTDNPSDWLNECKESAHSGRRFAVLLV